VIREPRVEEIYERPATGRGALVASPAYHGIKRAVDVVGAAILLVLLAPVFLIIAVAIVIDGGLPIIYRCERLGRNGRKIEVLKFRTMHNGSHHHLEELLTADEERRLEYGINRKLRHDPRRTRFGTFLRRYSLDELPQIWNVLIGEMSFIGPRPYMAHELRDRSEAVTLLSVRPGITGLWQVNGRSDRTFEERVALEVDYVQREGFHLDVSIVLRTFGAVISGRGAY
jgi:lipopolysaccharide/colanic/teichoic acid biosynthesis glycosyltransferase